MNKAIIKNVWIVHQQCDESLSHKYYVAVTTASGLNYRTKGLDTLDSVDFQLKRFKEGLNVSLNGLTECDSSGFELLY